MAMAGILCICGALAHGSKTSPRYFGQHTSEPYPLKQPKIGEEKKEGKIPNTDDGSHMKPGGWIEIQEFDGRVNCDDGTVAPDAPLKRFFDLIPKAMANFGMIFNAGENLRGIIEGAGFTNISCRILKVPYGTWAKASSRSLKIWDLASSPRSPKSEQREIKGRLENPGTPNNKLHTSRTRDFGSSACIASSPLTICLTPWRLSPSAR